MESQWITFAKRLQAISSTGLHFCRDEYDHERYGEVGNIADEMLAMIGSVPIEKIHGLVSDFAKGYATPKVDVRGAVIENESILLVREAAMACGHYLAASRTSAALRLKTSKKRFGKKPG